MEPLQPTDRDLNRGEVTSDWVNAPADSHVAGFQLIDRTNSRHSATSEIIVTFKGGGKNHRPPSTYRYTFSDHSQAKSVFAALSGADHPGEVIHAQLVKGNVPYIKVS